MKTGLQVQCRWLIRTDMEDVVRIEQQRVRGRLSESQIVNHLRQRNAIGTVIDIEDQVVGYMLYSIHSQSYRLHRIAVDAEFQRKGYGSALMRRMLDKLHPTRRSSIRFDVSEWETGMHLFLQKMGFFAESVREGNYRFFYELPREV